MNKKVNSKINSSATANLKTVGIRFPKNKIIRKILKNLSFPLAMPSANKSSGVSPVTPEDVSEEFNNKIKVIKGGVSKIGIESTVITEGSGFTIIVIEETKSFIVACTMQYSFNHTTDTGFKVDGCKLICSGKLIIREC